MKREIRTFQAPENIEFRAFEEDGNLYIEAYPALFNVESKLIFEWGLKDDNGKDIVERFYEKIEKNAFDNVLKNINLDVVYNKNHNDDFVMARTTSGTLELSVDETGLKQKAKIDPDISYANDIYKSIKRGDLFESSFSFNVEEKGYSFTRDDDGVLHRTIHEFSNLYDTATVTRGAYADTKVFARGLKEFLENENEIKNKKPIKYISEVERLRMEYENLKIKIKNEEN